jgi:hypothetical protein
VAADVADAAAAGADPVAVIVAAAVAAAAAVGEPRTTAEACLLRAKLAAVTTTRRLKYADRWLRHNSDPRPRLQLPRVTIASVVISTPDRSPSGYNRNDTRSTQLIPAECCLQMKAGQAAMRMIAGWSSLAAAGSRCWSRASTQRSREPDT